MPSNCKMTALPDLYEVEKILSKVTPTPLSGFTKANLNTWSNGKITKTPKIGLGNHSTTWRPSGKWSTPSKTAR